MEAPRKYAELKGDVTSLLEDTGRFLGRLVEAPKTDGGHQLLLDTKLSDFFARYTELKRRKEGGLSCAVLALTKSGKSTLLNALLGAVILPSSNVPETARITRITHTVLQEGQPPQLSYTSAQGEQRIIVGDYAIREHLRYLNREVRTRNYLSSDETYLDVHVPIATLEASEADPESISLQLLDTPGPNEAGEESLKFQVERLLDSVDAVIYILDYTKLKTQEEADLLKKLKDINPQLVARLSQRLFFVVNKVDLIHTSEGLENEEIKEYVADLVTKQLGSEGFRLSSDQVLLLSAQDAMLSRLILRNKAGTEERLRFGKLAFGSRRAQSTPDEEYIAAANDMLAESGLEQLESKVLSFLYSHSGGLKLLSVLDDTSRLLHQVRNVATATNAALQQDVQTLQEEAEKLQNELEDVLSQFDSVQQEADQIEQEVVDEVRGKMQALKEDLFEKVKIVLDSTPSSGARPALRDALAGRWHAAFDEAARFWARAAAQGSAARDELTLPLHDLHNDIHATIDAEVRDFWHALEAATNERQQAMFRLLNHHMKRLAQRVEAAVGEALEVVLEPAALHLDPPTAQQFHSDLQDLFDSAIEPREVERTREGQEEYVVWEKRRRRIGLCRYSEYYVGRPSSRTTTESYKETVFELKPDQIKDYFMKLVDDTVETSVRHVRSFVHQYLAARLVEARSAIEDYGQRYAEAMLSALDTSKKGEEARQAGLATVQQHLVTLNALLDTCTAMQHRTSLLLPGIANQHSLETHSLIAESIDGMVEDVQYEDAAEDFSNSPESPLPADGPVLELAESAPSQPSGTAVEQPNAAEPVNGAPIAQLQVGGAPLKSQIPDGRTQVEYAAWRQLQLNPAQVAAPARKRSNFPSQVDTDETAVATTKDDPPAASERDSTAVGKIEDTTHKDILSAIYGAGPEQQKGVTAKEAAAANLDRVINGPQSSAMAAQAAAASLSGYVDFAKWGMDGFTDSDEDEFLCTCGKVHPPTFHQEYRRQADKEAPEAPSEAPAVTDADAPKTESLLTTAAVSTEAPEPDLLDSLIRRCNTDENSIQDTGHFNTPATVEGDVKTASATQSSAAFDLNNAFEEWVRAGSRALSVEGEEVADEAAVLPASIVPSEEPKEDHSPATALDHTLNESDDWTLVEDEDSDEAIPSKA
ncbi:g8012 [Coccomyxa elongata]